MWFGRRPPRISQRGNVSDAIAQWAPPPSYYAPMPEDFDAPPPPPPNISVCADFGRRISVSGCV
jgi:hypothetical protein